MPWHSCCVDRRGRRALLQVGLLGLRRADLSRPRRLRRRSRRSARLCQHRPHRRDPDVAAQHLRLGSSRHRRHPGAVASPSSPPRRCRSCSAAHSGSASARSRARPRRRRVPPCHRLRAGHAVAVVPALPPRAADVAARLDLPQPRDVPRHPQGWRGIRAQPLPGRTNHPDPDPSGRRLRHRGSGGLWHRRPPGVPAGPDRVRHRRLVGPWWDGDRCSEHRSGSRRGVDLRQRRRRRTSAPSAWW